MLKKLSSSLKVDQSKKQQDKSKSKKDKLSDALRINLLKRKEFQKKLKSKD